MRIFLRGKHLQYNVHCRIIGYRRGGRGSNFLSNPPPRVSGGSPYFLGVGGGGQEKGQEFIAAPQGRKRRGTEDEGVGVALGLPMQELRWREAPGPLSLEEDIYLGVSGQSQSQDIRYIFFSKLSPGIPVMFKVF